MAIVTIISLLSSILSLVTVPSFNFHYAAYEHIGPCKSNESVSVGMSLCLDEI